MPAKNTRHWAKRKLVSAKGNIDTCGQHIYEVSSVYQEAHPEISERLNLILALLTEVDSLIDSVESGI